MSEPLIVIVDSGLGNTRSVANAFLSLGYLRVGVSDRAADLNEASHIILPGVGAFGEGMNLLARKNLIAPLREEVMVHKKPFLGICLGMQLLAETGSEMGTHRGLGWIEGAVDRLPVDRAQLRLPHVGWNEVQASPSSRLFGGTAAALQFYFVHSYHLVPKDPGVTAATCEYGVRFAAAVECGNICGAQFHPEKSQRDGLRLLSNFIKNFHGPV